VVGVEEAAASAVVAGDPGAEEHRAHGNDTQEAASNHRS
jgi:hypothetical protein